MTSEEQPKVMLFVDEAAEVFRPGAAQGTAAQLITALRRASRSDEIAVGRDRVELQVSDEGRVAISWGNDDWHIVSCHATGGQIDGPYALTELREHGDNWRSPGGGRW